MAAPKYLNELEGLPPSRYLVECLDHTFPAAAPKPTDSDKDIMFNAGIRHLIERLLELKEKGEEILV